MWDTAYFEKHAPSLMFVGWCFMLASMEKNKTKKNKKKCNYKNHRSSSRHISYHLFNKNVILLFFFPVFTYGSLTTHYPREYKKLSLPVKMTQNPKCTYTGLCDLHLVVLLEIAIICNNFFGSGLTKCYNAAHHAMLT